MEGGGGGWSRGHRQSFVAAISHPLPVMTRLEARMISSTGVTADSRAQSPRAGLSGTAGRMEIRGGERGRGTNLKKRVRCRWSRRPAAAPIHKSLLSFQPSIILSYFLPGCITQRSGRESEDHLSATPLWKETGIDHVTGSTSPYCGEMKRLAAAREPQSE